MKIRALAIPFANSLAILLALTACTQPANEPPQYTRVSPGVAYLRGATSTLVTVESEGDWELEPEASWLTAFPSQGTGNQTVELRVDHSALAPGEYTTNLRVTEVPSGLWQNVQVVFAFPRLTGRLKLAEEGGLLLSANRPAPNVPEGPGRLLVGLEATGLSTASVDPQERFGLAARGLASATGVSLRRTFPTAGVAVFETGDMRRVASELARNPNVRYVEADRELELLAVNDEYRLQQWSLDVMDVEAAWTVEQGMGSGVRVAIIDGGFQPQPGHPDKGDAAYAYDFEYNTSSVQANPGCNSHGEHVAGIVGATAGNGIGVAGIAPAVELLLLDVSTDDENCPLTLSALIAALDWVTNSGSSPRAEIVNMSLGSPSNSQAVHDAVKAAHSAGVTLVAAAGNSGGPVFYPAAYPEVIAVSATGRYDELAFYSNTGPEVFVSAPGGNAGVQADAIISTYYDAASDTYGYAYMQGTSMASPAVAAVAALVKAVNPAFTPDDIAQILADSSVDLGEPGRDGEFGHGRVDAFAAVELAMTTTPSPTKFLLRRNGEIVAEVPSHGTFDLGYAAPGEVELEADTDEDGDGVYGGSGDYSSGPWIVEVAFDGRPATDVEIVLEKNP